MPSDRYIPTPHDGQYLGDTVDPRRDAEERGNPYPYGTGRWFAWNEGYQASVHKVVSRMVGLSDKPKNGAPRR